MPRYTMTVDVHDPLPTMQVLVDAVADELERRGYDPNGGYEVRVEGPAELRLVVEDRQR